METLWEIPPEAGETPPWVSGRKWMSPNTTLSSDPLHRPKLKKIVSLKDNFLQLQKSPQKLVYPWSNFFKFLLEKQLCELTILSETEREPLTSKIRTPVRDLQLAFSLFSNVFPPCLSCLILSLIHNREKGWVILCSPHYPNHVSSIFVRW